MPIGDFPESLSQAMLVGCNVSREIGRMHGGNTHGDGLEGPEHEAGGHRAIIHRSVLYYSTFRYIIHYNILLLYCIIVLFI